MKRVIRVASIWIAASSCGGDNTSSNVEAPGAKKNAKTKALEVVADLL
jgi:hypothetical protein